MKLSASMLSSKRLAWSYFSESTFEVVGQLGPKLTWTAPVYRWRCNDRQAINENLALNFEISKIFDFHITGKIIKNGRENQVRDFLLCSGRWLTWFSIDFWLFFFANFHFLQNTLIFETKIANMTWKEEAYAKVLLGFGFPVRSYTDFLDSRLLTRFLTPSREGPKLDPLCSVKF